MNKQRLSDADHISGLFFKKITGSITNDEQRELDEWISESANRRQYVELMANAYFLQEEYQRQKTIDAHRAIRQMQERIASEYPQVKTISGWRRYRYAIAASVVILIVGGLFWYWQYSQVVPPAISPDVQQAIALSAESGRQEAQVEPVVTARQSKQAVVQTLKQKYNITREDVVEQLLEAKRITTRSDREFWLTLPDGSLVHLNYNTRVIYPDQFTGDARDVILDGEAYFMVARDRRHPFIVHTSQGDIKEYGTEFNVSTRGETGGTEVVLVEGSVSVSPIYGKEQMLQPGQKSVIYGQKTEISEIDIEPYVAWNTGNFVFEDYPLGRLMDVLSRWYGLEVEFHNAATRDILFTGILSRYADISALLKAIGTVADVDIVVTDNHIIIY